MDITIKKIKAKKGKLVFEYDKRENEDSLISTHKSTFEEEPEPSFYEAFAELCVDVCKILEISPGKYAERMKPTGVTFSEDSSGCGCAIITCEYRMLQSMTTTTINTPLLRLMDVEDEALEPGYFEHESYMPAPPFYCDEPTSAHLLILQKEAVRYLEGHRGQGSLFDDEEQEAQSEEPEDSPVRLAASSGSAHEIQKIAVL